MQQVPVIGFNSGSYDLNLIKKYFVDRISERGTVWVVKKESKTMFSSTREFKSLDIINYAVPGASYTQWISAYGAKQAKSWFPYE